MCECARDTSSTWVRGAVSERARNAPSTLGVFKNDEVSKIDDPGIVSHGFDLAESKYVG